MRKILESFRERRVRPGDFVYAPGAMEELLEYTERLEKKLERIQFQSVQCFNCEAMREIRRIIAF